MFDTVCLLLYCLGLWNLLQLVRKLPSKPANSAMLSAVLGISVAVAAATTATQSETVNWFSACLGLYWLLGTGYVNQFEFGQPVRVGYDPLTHLLSLICLWPFWTGMNRYAQAQTSRSTGR